MTYNGYTPTILRKCAKCDETFSNRKSQNCWHCDKSPGETVTPVIERTANRQEAELELEITPELVERLQRRQ